MILFMKCDSSRNVVHAGASGQPRGLCPLPRLHLTRFHGVLASNARSRSTVAPGHVREDAVHTCEHTTHSKLVRMGWARMLRQVFDSDIERRVCGGKLKFVAVVERPEVIEMTITHLKLDPLLPAMAPARREAWRRS